MPGFSTRTRLVGVDLRSVDLGGSALAGADLRRADLRGVDLSKRDLRGADLRGALLDGANLAGSLLDDVDLDRASLVGADLRGAHLARTSGFGVKAAGVHASGANFDGAEWREADLVGAELDGVRGIEWRLDRARLTGADLGRARLDRVVLDEADLDDTNLSGARMVAAALYLARGRPRLDETDLRRADLRVADPSLLGVEGAQLQGARFTRAAVRAMRPRLRAQGWSPPGTDRFIPILARQLAFALAWLRSAAATVQARWAEWRAHEEEQEELDEEVVAPEPEAEPEPAAPKAPRPPSRLLTAIKDFVKAEEEAPVASRPFEIDDERESAFPRAALARERAIAASARAIELRALGRLRDRAEKRLADEREQRRAARRATAEGLRARWQAARDEQAKADLRTRARAQLADVPGVDVQLPAQRTTLDRWLQAGIPDAEARMAPGLAALRRRWWSWRAGIDPLSRALPRPLPALDRGVRRSSFRVGRRAREAALTLRTAALMDDAGARARLARLVVWAAWTGASLVIVPAGAIVGFGATQPWRQIRGARHLHVLDIGSMQVRTGPRPARVRRPARPGWSISALRSWALARVTDLRATVGAGYRDLRADPVELGDVPLDEDLREFRRDVEARMRAARSRSFAADATARARAATRRLAVAAAAERAALAAQELIDREAEAAAELLAREAEIARRRDAAIAERSLRPELLATELRARRAAEIDRAQRRARDAAEREASAAAEREVREAEVARRRDAALANRALEPELLAAEAVARQAKLAEDRARAARTEAEALARTTQAAEDQAATSLRAAEVATERRMEAARARVARRDALARQRAALVGAGSRVRAAWGRRIAAAAAAEVERARRIADRREALLQVRAEDRDVAARHRALAAAAAALAARDDAARRAAAAEVRAQTAMMALEAERARAARAAERAKVAAETEMERLEAAAHEADARVARVAAVLARATPGPSEVPSEIDDVPEVDETLLVELRARAAARRRAVSEQADRVREARIAALAATRQRFDARGRAVASAVRRGVSALREAMPGPRGPIVVGPGANLAGERLDDRDLAGANLRGAILVGAGFVGTDLRGADLRDADLRNADLTAARLDAARLDGALLDGAVFDQATLAGASLDNTQVIGARFASARGLDPRVRGELQARGADAGLAEEGRLARTSAIGVAAAAVLIIGVYLGARFATGDDLDAASLEHAAAEAQRVGDPAQAAVQFATLAEASQDPDGRVGYWLEAAGSAEEAEDLAGALSYLEKALVAADGTGSEARVLLLLAQAHVRAGLKERAANELRAMLERVDLSPEQVAQSIVGLRSALPEELRDEATHAAEVQIDQAATDPERGAIAMALADAWSGTGDNDAAGAALDRALSRVTDPDETVTLRLRRARLQGDQGDADGALASYRLLLDSAGDAEARLGAAELLSRRGQDDEAITLLTPLLDDPKADRQSRASLALANIAQRRGDTDRAVSLLTAVLEMEGLESRQLDDARIQLARLKPEAAEALVADNPELQVELLLGRARSLREGGDRAKARELWVQVIENPAAGEEARIDAEISLADLEVEDADYGAAITRYDRVLEETTSANLRQRVALGKGNALVRSGKLQDAEASFSALLSHSVGDVADQCRLGLARAAELRGQTDKSTRLYEEVGRGTGPWAIEALVSIGRMRETAGDLPGAIAAWRVARARPGGEISRMTAIDISLAQALDALGDPEAATVYEGLLNASDPEVRVQARIAVGEKLLATDPARAQTLLEEALGEVGTGEGRAAVRTTWLRATLSLGQVDAGLERAKAWLATETDAPVRGELALGTVKALRLEGRGDDAVALAETWKADGGFELAMETAGALRELGRAADAVTWLQGVTGETAEDERWRQEQLAGALSEAGDVDAATRAWKQLGAQEGGATAARLGQARLKREQGDYEGALRLLADLDDPRAAVERAEALTALGRADEARTAWRRLTLAPDLEVRSAAWVGLARLNLDRGNPIAALASLDELGDKLDPGYALTAGQVRAEALLAVGRVDLARAVYASLTADAEARVVSKLGLAACAIAADDATAARALYTEAATMTPDAWYRGQALLGVVKANVDLGDRAAADAALARMREETPGQVDALAEAESALAPR